MNDKIASKRYGRAIVQLSRELNRFPPYGIDTEGNILRSEWKNNSEREFRLDIENFGGTNLSTLRYGGAGKLADQTS